MSTTIGDTRKVADQLAGQITDQANTLKSNATKSLLLTSIATLVLLLLLLISAVLARPLRKQRADTPADQSLLARQPVNGAGHGRAHRSPFSGAVRTARWPPDRRFVSVCAAYTRFQDEPG